MIIIMIMIKLLGNNTISYLRCSKMPSCHFCAVHAIKAKIKDYLSIISKEMLLQCRYDIISFPNCSSLIILIPSCFLLFSVPTFFHFLTGFGGIYQIQCFNSAYNVFYASL